MKKIIENPEETAYELIFKKKPKGKTYEEIAEEVLNFLVESPEAIPNDLGRQFIYDVVQGGNEFSSEEAKLRITMEAEIQAPVFFPEIKGVREVHMDQLEVAYRKWRGDYPAKFPKENKMH